MRKLFGLKRSGFVPSRVADKRIRSAVEALETRRLFAVYTVNSVADAQGPDSSLTLVEAISLVNGNLVYGLLTSAERAQVNLSQPAGVNDTIDFNIPGTGTHEIDITHALPTITKPVTIDGYSQPGSAVATSTSPAKIGVTLAGTFGNTLAGLTISSSYTTIRGLSIVGFGAAAIQVSGDPVHMASGNNIIAGNWLGIAPLGGGGVTSSPNLIGVSLYQTSLNTIGGTTPADRNVISANSRDGIDLLDTDDDVVEGNYIGVDPTGTSGIPNTTGIEMHDVNYSTNGIIIGGMTSGTRNVISNNQGDGIYIHGTGPTNNTIEGNYIGTNAAGTKPLGNGANGVAISGDGTTEVATIGGDWAAMGNVISGNHGSGISIDNTGHASNSITITSNYIGVSADGKSAMGNDQDGVFINGTRPIIGKAGAGNVISANGSTNTDLLLSSGIALENVTLVSVTDPGIYVNANSIGTNAAGTAALGNKGDGIYAVNGYFMVLGELGNANRNIISGNGHNGLTLQTFGDAAVVNDFIGVLADGKTAAGNKFDGVLADGISPYNSIGGANAGDIIANSGFYGVELVGTSAGVPADNLISQNSIYNNGSLGISIEGDANFNPALPVISSAVYDSQSVTVTGTLSRVPNTVVLEFFANDKPDASGFGQGRQYLGSLSVTPDLNGNASFKTTLNVSIGSNLYISATATSPGVYPGDTSAFAKTIKAAPNLPAQPGNLKAVANSPTQITLTWADNSNNETGFEVQRSTSSSFTSPSTFNVAANATTYVDKTASPSTTYYYRVRAVNALGASDYATAVKVTSLTPLAMPGNLAGKAVAGLAVTLTWKDNASGETGYEIQASTSSSFTTVAKDITVSTANLSTYKVTGLTAKTVYYFRVRAVSKTTPAVDSAWSSSVKLQTLSA
jgi:hypothetical protein